MDPSLNDFVQIFNFSIDDDEDHENEMGKRTKQYSWIMSNSKNSSLIRPRCTGRNQMANSCTTNNSQLFSWLNQHRTTKMSNSSHLSQISFNNGLFKTNQSNNQETINEPTNDYCLSVQTEHTSTMQVIINNLRKQGDETKQWKEDQSSFISESLQTLTSYIIYLIQPNNDENNEDDNLQIQTEE
ncbi:hypothetical protein BLOT_008233 [Blomia tropicalis]|nr:hypothetical protein BLOT_008233 [Blomia tropicalis]